MPAPTASPDELREKLKRLEDLKRKAKALTGKGTPGPHQQIEGESAYESNLRRNREARIASTKRGQDIGLIPPVKDWERRLSCQNDLELFATTYLPRQFYLKFCDDQRKVIRSGFSGCRFDRWYEEKHGGKVERKEHSWVKAHVACGTKTNVITAAVVLEKNSADCPQFAGLTKATAQGFKIGEMSADKAYLSGENVDAIFGIGGVPFIAPKTNTTGGIGGLFAKMFHYFQYRKDEFMQHYHRRSNVESVFSAVKRKFGDSVRSKCDAAMVNEVLCKLLAHNLCVLIQEQHELGIDPVFWKDEQEESRAVLPMVRLQPI